VLFFRASGRPTRPGPNVHLYHHPPTDRSLPLPLGYFYRTPLAFASEFRPVGVAGGWCSSPFQTRRLPGALHTSPVELLVLSSLDRSITRGGGRPHCFFRSASVALLRGDNKVFFFVGTGGGRFKVLPRRRQRRDGYHEAGLLRQLRPRHPPVRPRAPLLQV
jgi:hypothetical protein